MGTKNQPGAFDCYEHALPDEPIFVLLARDRCAPEIVRVWATMRENRLRASDVTCTPGEVMAELDQIAEARQCADDMETYRKAQMLDRAAQRRLGCGLSCACWWADPPGAIETGYPTKCPTHGDVTVTSVNVYCDGDDGVSEYIGTF